MKCNDDSGRTLTGTLSANIADLIAYVKAGFAPTNTALRNAGHDGVTIGAVEGVFIGTGGGRDTIRSPIRSPIRSALRAA